MIDLGDVRFQRMRAVLKGLPRLQRQAYLLWRIDSWNDIDIARKLRTTPAEVRSDINAAHKKLVQSVFRNQVK